MIAKQVPSPKGGGRFGDLGAYITDGKRHAVWLGPEGEGAEWSRLGSYVIDQAHDGEKVAAAWTSNIEDDDLAWGIKAVEATQALARKGTGGQDGKTIHIVVSLAPGEKLALDIMKQIEERVADRLGLSEHQRIAAVHQNTDCMHMHIAINKVHPETLRTVTPFQSHNKLRALCRELEIEHDLTPTSIGRDAQRHMSEDAARMEIHQGRESFTTWAQEKARAPLLAARDAGQGWQAVHEAAARLGLEIKPRGAGLVASPVGSVGYGIKASAIDRGLGIKAMTDRLGDYQAPQAGRPLPEAQDRYTSEPLQKGAAVKALSDAYERARAQALKDRDTAFKAMQAEQGDYRKRLDAWADSERARIRHGRFSAFDPDKYGKLRDVSVQRAKLQVAAREERRNASEKIRDTHKIPTWQDFLEQRAHAGDEAALETLRQGQDRRKLFTDTLVSAETAAQARHVIRWSQTRTVQRDGTVAYTLMDGGKVRDGAEGIGVWSETRGAAALAVQLAELRFGQSKLKVAGSDQFKRWMVEEAVRQDAPVTFTDPVFETMRVALARDKKTTQDLADIKKHVARPENSALQTYSKQYKVWSPVDQGRYVFEGRAPLRDGATATLWRQGDMIVYMRETQPSRETGHLTPGDVADLRTDGIKRPGGRRPSK